jgi:hypothetical protein
MREQIDRLIEASRHSHVSIQVIAADVETLVDCWDTLVREALPWATSQSLLEEAAKSWTTAT